MTPLYAATIRSSQGGRQAANTAWHCRGLPMPLRHRALWTLAVILSMALLLTPALWNGFALLHWDSGGYLARWYEGTLEASRAVVYGLMLTASGPLWFWPVLLRQTAAAVARHHRRAVGRYHPALADRDLAHRYLRGAWRAGALSLAPAQRGTWWS